MLVQGLQDQRCATKPLDTLEPKSSAELHNIICTVKFHSILHTDCTHVGCAVGQLVKSCLKKHLFFPEKVVKHTTLAQAPNMLARLN